MAWIESHQTLRDHPKTKKAARLLGIARQTVIGYLWYLWWWAIDYAPQGDLTDFTDQDIETAVEWDGTPGTFVPALLDCGLGGRPGFLERTQDGRLLIHDWWDYAGNLISRRQANAQRMRDKRAADAADRATHVQDTFAARAGHVRSTCRTRTGATDRQTDKQTDIKTARAREANLRSPNTGDGSPIGGLLEQLKAQAEGRAISQAAPGEDGQPQKED